jgi:nucleotide-binding universal stress UspA family protein
MIPVLKAEFNKENRRKSSYKALVIIHTNNSSGFNSHRKRKIFSKLLQAIVRDSCLFYNYPVNCQIGGLVMYKKMLVLLDGSKLAEVVFSYAQQLTARLDMEPELLHVCNPQEAEQLPMRQAYMAHMAEILQGRAADIRSKFGKETKPGEIKAKSSVVIGYPAEEIIKYADENKIDIIMLSTHGRSGVRMWDLGAVAEKVIHAAKVPVWLVPTELREDVIWDKLGTRKLVIPLDGSPLAEEVIQHSIDLVKQRGIESQFEIVLINVSPMPVTTNLAQVSKLENDLAEMEKYLDEMVKKVQAQGIKANCDLLRSDNTAKAIVSYVESHPTQLLALATRGHEGISKMVFGSVAEEILHSVKTTPMLIVRPGG